MAEEEKMAVGIREPDAGTMKYNLTRILGGDELVMPRSYIVIDLETTGLSVGQAVIWQIGVYPVLDGEPRYKQGHSVWVHTDPAQLKEATFEINRRTGRSWSGERGLVKDGEYQDKELEFVEEVQSKGVGRKAALEATADLLRSYEDAGYPTIAQNGYRFDRVHLDHEFKYSGVDYRFPQAKLIDVGILFKAAVMKRRILGRETPGAFYDRVSSERAKGVFYALEKALIPHYNLIEKHGIDMARAHNAGWDCYVTSLVLRSMLEEVLGEEDL
jgi:DNA polymerase III epsilon subunit-like protein